MSTSRSVHHVSATITLTNSGETSLNLLVEPWAREYEVPSGGTRQVALSGPGDAEIEIQIRSAGITLFGWVGSELQDNINLPGARVPPTP